jgi:hypothetical protein
MMEKLRMLETPVGPDHSLVFLGAAAITKLLPRLCNRSVAKKKPVHRQTEL